MFARPSFVSGLARILDFGGTLNEYSDTTSDDEADYRALESDSLAVGDAIREAASQAKLEIA
jgi:hypothetical protein